MYYLPVPGHQKSRRGWDGSSCQSFKGDSEGDDETVFTSGGSTGRDIASRCLRLLENLFLVVVELRTSDSTLTPGQGFPQF